MIRYANFHILHPLAFSNPNRDDTGAPKTTTYGGTVRGRMSSQSQKRAARTAFEGQTTADRTHRSKYAADRLLDTTTTLLAANGTTLTPDQTEKLHKSVRTEIGKLTGKADDAKATLVWLAEAELNGLAAKLAVKAGAEMTKDDIDAALSTTTDSLTIAAFGRMFASRADLAIEAAAQVGHAFTTHAQANDLDYLTAFDDLQASYDTPDDDGNVKGAGAGHLDVNEFHSGVFYRYFNLNRDDLTDNWRPLTNQGAPGTTERLEAFLREMTIQLPTGRDATAAHQTPPAYVMVTFTERAATLAPAFETPVAGGANDGYLPGSIAALTGYADAIARIYGPDHRIVVNLTDPDAQTTLADLTGAVANWVVSGTLSTP
ncbi:CRISPR-associated protein, Cse4 family (plasmid) [Euzebya pacifica]|uniref:CRISPR-associated protein, Cse4 family n=1 Tax=Euzebya pacifica TaxID=1608957 RepID=A0A346Y608_9ACTN|nr:type I-E CRISPR-associated protein Cas7/Cse4/CasC [Euzebya pacifica]AXV09905.1 CRISPR-associated protein, Cse4 family [Euzebya pacifica]